MSGLGRLCDLRAPALVPDLEPLDVDIGAPTAPALLCGLHLCTPKMPADEHHAICIGWTTEARLKWTLKAARAARPNEATLSEVQRLCTPSSGT